MVVELAPAANTHAHDNLAVPAPGSRVAAARPPPPQSDTSDELCQQATD